VLHAPRLREIVDILLISFLIHRGVLLARGAAARRALTWLAALALIYWVALQADLALTAWALRSVGWVALVAFVILCRHEIREALAEARPLNLLLGRGEPPDRSGPATSRRPSATSCGGGSPSAARGARGATRRRVPGAGWPGT
jgi:hypothetical protein